MDFRTTSITALAEQVRNREVSARELTQAALDNIDRLDGEINSFCAVNAELALADADAVDEKVASGDPDHHHDLDRRLHDQFAHLLSRQSPDDWG